MSSISPSCLHANGERVIPPKTGAFQPGTIKYFFKTIPSIVCSLLLGISTTANAAGWTPLAAITNTQISETTLYVQLDTNVTSNVNSCSSWDGWFVIYESTSILNDFQKIIFATVLSAEKSNEKIKIYSAGCNAVNFNSLDTIKIN